MKKTQTWFSLQRDRTRNGLTNIKETFAESLQLQMNVSSAPTYDHFPVFNARLSSSYDDWEKCKGKIPDVSDPNQDVETRSHSKLKFT